MSPDLLDLLSRLFAAANSGDADTLEAQYAPEFVALRIGARGVSWSVPREEILAGTDAAGDDLGAWTPPDVAAVDVLHTAVEDDRGVVVYRWGAADQSLVFTLVWDLEPHPPLLARAFAVEPGLA